MATAFEEVTHAGPDVLKQRELVPPTFSGETVWIGFMDIVPVIGTLRESVELVLAVYEGNEAVVQEKEEAIESIVKGSSQKHVRKVSVPVKPAEDEYSGLRNVREVRMGMITEYMAKGSKRGTKPVPLSEAEKKKRIEAIYKDMLEKIRIIKPKFTYDLKEELRRSKRGEHVFNNDILKFHSKVLEKFTERMKINSLRGYKQNPQALDELDSHTLPPNTAEEIQTNMVVHFEEDEFYVNANAVIYGVFCSALRETMLYVLCRINIEDKERDRQHNVYIREVLFKACCDVLRCLNPKVLEKMDRQNREKIYNALVEGRLDELSRIIPDMREEIHEALHEARLNVLSDINLGVVDFIIDIMNKYEIYVDKLAKEKWFQRETRQRRFEVVKQEVVKMYKTDCGVDWCIRILDEVAPWFST